MSDEAIVAKALCTESMLVPLLRGVIVSLTGGIIAFDVEIPTEVCVEIPTEVCILVAVATVVALEVVVRS